MNSLPKCIAYATQLPVLKHGWNVKDTESGAWILAHSVGEKRAKQIAAAINSGALDARSAAK